MPKITEAHLPPVSMWPDKIYSLPEIQNYPDKMNSTAEFVDKNVQNGRGNCVAIYFKDERITYRELYYMVNRLANGLKEQGVEEEDRVIIRSTNRPEALVANFAIIKMGAVSVPTSPLLSPAELVHICNNTEAKAIICEAGLLSAVETAMDGFETVEKIIVIGGNEPDKEGFVSYAHLLAIGEKEFGPVLRSRLSVSFLLFTSGTTGLPKGTAHFMEDQLIIADIWGKYCYGGVKPDDVIGAPAPMAFAAGYSVIASIPFRFGASCSMIPKFAPDNMFRTIEDHGITITKMPPTAYRKMLLLAEGKWDLSSLRVCTSGGEALDTKTFNGWKDRFGQEIYEAFGSTEMLFSFAVNVFGQPPLVGSPGKATPGYEIKVVDEDGKECQDAEVGQLFVRGPTGTVYWRPYENNGELLKKQRSVVIDGWNRTGDYVYLDENGYVIFVARENDLIKSSGYRIGPGEIEDALVKHPAVKDAGVIGVPDPIRGENVKAYLALQDNYSFDEELQQDILSFLRNIIAVYKLPREFEVLKEIPRTSAGKIVRRLLREK